MSQQTKPQTAIEKWQQSAPNQLEIQDGGSPSDT